MGDVGYLDEQERFWFCGRMSQRVVTAEGSAARLERKKSILDFVDRRYAALRRKMAEHKLDAIIAPGGPSHWSFGGGMTWLTGHWEWHALASYVLVPLDGEPTLIFSIRMYTPR